MTIGIMPTETILILPKQSRLTTAIRTTPTKTILIAHDDQGYDDYAVPVCGPTGTRRTIRDGQPGAERLGWYYFPFYLAAPMFAEMVETGRTDQSAHGFASERHRRRGSEMIQSHPTFLSSNSRATSRPGCLSQAILAGQAGLSEPCYGVAFSHKLSRRNV
jgi:hypothetical protein